MEPNSDPLADLPLVERLSIALGRLPHGTRELPPNIAAAFGEVLAQAPLTVAEVRGLVNARVAPVMRGG